MLRRPIPMRGYSAKVTANPAACASWVEEGKKTVQWTVFPTTALMENRNGLTVDCELTKASGTAEREAALAMIKRSRKGKTRAMRKTRVTLGAGKGYDAQDFVLKLKGQKVTPHIAINGTVSKAGKARKTAVDGRTTRHQGYGISQRCRKRIEESFGWVKTIGGAAKLKLRGLAKAKGFFTFQMIAYNLIRIPKLLAQAA